MKATRVLAFVVVVALAACSRAPVTPPPPPPATPPDLHSQWQFVLDRYTDHGLVDYATLNATRGDLARYLRRLEAIDRPTYERMARPDQIALWINAHNAYTIGLILEFWPVTSVRQASPMVKRGPGGVFAREFIPLGKLIGLPRALSLDDIADGILRKRFGDARANFALARACVSCPTLASQAYVGDLLDSQLDAAARRFLADGTKNRFDPDRRELMASPLFQWNAADFQAVGGELGVFRRYGPEESVAELKALSRTPTIRYSAWDWSINAK
jgi:hypothetical protein